MTYRVDVECFEVLYTQKFIVIVIANEWDVGIITGGLSFDVKYNKIL